MAKAKTDKRIDIAVDMYKQGVSTTRIADTLHIGVDRLYRILREKGLYTKQKGGSNMIVYSERRELKPITAADILKIRSRIKVGDVINVKTQKGAPDGEAGINAIPGVKKKAKVVDVSHRRFCIVEFANGAHDCILWSSFVIAERNKQSWV